jgi:hypothetical protein
VWKVAQVHLIPASTPLPDPNADMPECVPVAAPSGKSPGCAKKSDLFPTPGSGRLNNAPVPVYASKKSSRVLGYMVPGGGYVPKRLAARIPEIVACAHALSTSPPTAPTPACRALLLDDGYDAKMLDHDGVR